MIVIVVVIVIVAIVCSIIKRSVVACVLVLLRCVTFIIGVGVGVKVIISLLMMVVVPSIMTGVTLSFLLHLRLIERVLVETPARLLIDKLWLQVLMWVLYHF